MRRGLALGCLCVLWFGGALRAQSLGGTVKGKVADPTGAAEPSASVTISNPVSHYERTVQTDTQGAFEFDNLPVNNYHIAITAAGFQNAEQDVNVRSAAPVEVAITLKIGQASTEVTVSDSADLVETTPSTHTDVDRELFNKLPLESESSSLSSLVTLATPGIAADSNGLFHGLGDHASNSFSVDGEQITDQQSKVFSNQIPTDSVQSMEVIEGAPPAEYGDKTSVVVVVTTRSGMGVTQPHGDATASYGTFGTSNAAFDLAYGGPAWGNFISMNGMNTGRFLDGPELQVMHDHGNQQNLFDRVDIKPSQIDTITLNLGFTRSWFQTPNSYDAQNATAWNGLVADNGGLGPNGLMVGSEDQRSKIGTYNVAPTWMRLISPSTVLTVGASLRRDQYNYYPSRNPFADFTPDLQLQTIGQDRSLMNAAAHAEIAYAKGIHDFKAGIHYEQTFLTENDSLGIVDPTFNAVCLNGDGSPNLSPGLTDPGQCATGGFTANPSFVPLLGCYDLTRPAPLPASDGCPRNTSGLYSFYGHTDVKQLALYAQDNITLKNWTFNLGLRGETYNGLSTAHSIQPRLGAAYNIKGTNTVLRVSYAHTLETPFNENLVLSSTGCNDAVINTLMSITQGYPCLTAPLRPGTRNEFHAGLQQAFGKYVVFDGEYIWKYTNGAAYDFSVLGNTPITFPIEWIKSKIPGAAGRISVPDFHGLSAFLVFSHVAARFFTPQVSGIGATPGGSQVFRIDHDEAFNETAHVQYQPWKKLPWISLNWRYDSGLVAGAVPCAGGNCANGPAGTDAMVDVSGITPDQQFEAGLFCGNVYATPTTGISPGGICAASQYGSKFLSIPAAGTEDDDHNPPRVAARNLVDLAIGDDNIFHSDRRKWSARVTVVNLTNKQALYNFLSTFSGTHYVSPRTVTAQIGLHF
ncbi:MAG TPA: TonB-dependent receptor [Bryobacteraceae bacterium]|nr:TonB-dependent receptor [Bryobacteraceae bacterium]